MPPRLLVVEDNPVNLELMVAVLERENCQVVTAETAEAGLDLAMAEPPDLILMDIQLPGMTGYEAMRRLKASPATAGIPVVALTAHATKGQTATAWEAGFEAVITKPIDLEVFHATLRRILDARPGAK